MMFLIPYIKRDFDKREMSGLLAKRSQDTQPPFPPTGKGWVARTECGSGKIARFWSQNALRPLRS